MEQPQGISFLEREIERKVRIGKIWFFIIKVPGNARSFLVHPHIDGLFAKIIELVCKMSTQKIFVLL